MTQAHPAGLTAIIDRVNADRFIIADPARFAAVLASMLAGKKVAARDAQVVARALTGAAVDLQWPARRYADGRSTYAVGMVNGDTRVLLALGLDVRPDPITDPPTCYAIDGMYGYPGYAQAAAVAADRQAHPESKFDEAGFQ